MYYSWGMRNGVEVRLRPGDRERLEAVLSDRNSPQKHVWRARIILATAEGCGTTEVMRRAGVSKPCVWRWQRRFMEAGVDGLVHDKTRKPGKAPVPDQVVARLIERTLGDPPGETTHWTSRAMASAIGLAISTVQKIWRVHGLAPHRLRTFKLSRDKRFVEKLHDVVGLYLNPPDKALVLCVDEKSQIQALDRTQPLLPLRPGVPARQTHDYKRNGTTNLFAALNMLDGTVIGDCMPRHRHQEFIRFLQLISVKTPLDLDLHLIVDNYGTHKHPRVQSWLKRHPRFHLHFIPTSSSWLNMVERWFREITDRRIRRGSFQNVPDLIAAINQYIQTHNQNPKVFVWSASVERIMGKIAKCKEALETLH